MLRKLLLAAAALLTSVACMPLSAAPRVQVDVVDRDSGQWLPTHPWRGDTWVAGTPGHRYSVRLTNSSGERVLVVLSVDGVNAVTGQTAHPSQAGYVLAPWETAEISGWRKSLDDIAQFVFTDLGDSYASRTGRPRNVGVIGIAVFREASHVRVPHSHGPPVAKGSGLNREEARANAPSAAREATDSVAAQGIGTGHGQREWAPIGQTHFVRASGRPAQVSELRYDETGRLARLGIIPQPYRQPYRSAAGHASPRAFPEGFVPDPH